MTPIILLQLKSSTVNSGDTVKFQTQAQGNPAPTVSWYKDDQPLEMTPKIKEFYENDIWTLILLEVEPEDSGCYEAVAENAHGKVFSRGNLTVVGDRDKNQEDSPVEEEKGKPKLYSSLFTQPFVEQPIVDQTVTEGVSVKFVCKIHHSDRKLFCRYYSRSFIFFGLKILFINRSGCTMV